MVAEIKDQEMGDEMQCMNHPYTKNPGGICAFCLQEKLGKLVSSSSPLAKQVFSSFSPSLRSDSVCSDTSGSISLSISVTKPANRNVNEDSVFNKNHERATRIVPFLLAKKKMSKSTATSRLNFSDAFSPRKRSGFWSFLNLSSSSSKHQSNATRKPDLIQERMTRNESGSSKDDKFLAKTSQNPNGSSKDGKFGARTSQNANGLSKDGKFGATTSQNANGSSKDGKFGATTSQNANGSSKDEKFGGRMNQNANESSKDCKFGATTSQDANGSSKDGKFGATTNQNANGSSKDCKFGATTSQDANGSSKDGKFGATTSQNANGSSKDGKFDATTNQNANGSSKDDKFGATMSQDANGSSKDGKFGATRSQNENAASSSSTTTCTAAMAASFTKKGTIGIKDFSVIAEEEEEDGNPNVAGNNELGHRKISRSRSVGCGYRNVSSDFFERISNGFNDCSLRRVESQRESKSNNVGSLARCGGIFSGFMIMASSSSSSSTSSATWVSSDNHLNGIKQGSFGHGSSRNRSWGWGWTFGSPWKAFSGTNAASNKSFGRIIIESSHKNTTPNLNTIPSLMAVRSKNSICVRDDQIVN